MESTDSETPEEIQLILKSLVDEFDKEDQTVRERQIRTYKKLKLYWNGFQRVWWDASSNDLRVWDETTDNDDDSAYYDKPINVFRAYLESIIAALSINIPAVRCFPGDADNPLDISTAKAGNKAYNLIANKHNNANSLWLQALYIYCTEGLVHCYHYSKEDEEFGVYQVSKTKGITTEAYVCPSCSNKLPEEMFAPTIPTLPEIEELPQELRCPTCDAVIDPELEKISVDEEVPDGMEEKAKTRQCLEVYGGLFVKTPTYAKTQKDMPYLNWSYETHYSNVIGRYPELKGKLDTNMRASTGGYDSYERWGRLSTQYAGEFPLDMVTVRNWWFRPTSFNVLEEEKTKLLKARYPNGVRVVMINQDCFAEAEEEKLDDRWTLAMNPLSDYIQFDPLGLFLVSIQDITNDLTALTLQTIEQGIPQTFADPAVLDFDAYRQQEAAPGSIYPTKAVSPSKNIADAFTTLKTSTLSQEVLPFGQTIQSMGQLSVGALPSIFGGEAQSGSKTASEYAMSRNQALQRLQNTWKMFNGWWRDIFVKVIPAFMDDMQEDEQFVEKDKQGNFFNVFIRKAEIQGKIGDIQLESSEQLPISWAQKRDIIKELFTMQIPGIIEALSAPENLPIVKEAFGLDDFVMPGEADRQKQYEEIQLLLNSEPMEESVPDPMTGMEVPMEQPSVPIDPLVDNHQVEADICRTFLVSEAGRQAKEDNPAGYKNVLLHMKLHMMEIIKSMQAQEQNAAAQEESAQGNTNGGSPKKEKENKPKLPTKQVAAQSGENNARQSVN